MERKVVTLTRDLCSFFCTSYFSCDTENCNTMDPRNSGDTTVTAPGSTTDPSNSGESTANTLGFTLGLNAIVFVIAKII